MPQEYLDIYNHGRDEYIAAMDTVLDQIADIVATGLSEARQRVSAGRQEIETYVAGQPEALRAIAQQAASDIQGKFDQLEQQIAAKETALIDSLAQRYSDHLQALDAEIEAAKAASRGLLARAGDLLGGVIGIFLELKAMLEGVLARAANAITTILANPMQFVGNLIDGIGQGLTQFMDNIGTHLQTGFVEWLTGTLSGAGIQIPENFDLPGIFDLAMQVLGLTYANIRNRAVGIFGEMVVAALETGFEIFHTLIARSCSCK
jgi:HPt (histidine-containing phosphotransfer) domain-containing protein